MSKKSEIIGRLGPPTNLRRAGPHKQADRHVDADGEEWWDNFLNYEDYDEGASEGEPDSREGDG